LRFPPIAGLTTDGSCAITLYPTHIDGEDMQLEDTTQPGLLPQDRGRNWVLSIIKVDSALTFAVFCPFSWKSSSYRVFQCSVSRSVSRAHTDSSSPPPYSKNIQRGGGLPTVQLAASKSNCLAPRQVNTMGLAMCLVVVCISALTALLAEGEK